MATFTVEQYNAIRAAIGSGELIVQHNGKRVEYRSMAELREAMTIIESDLIAAGLLAAPSAGGVVRGSTTYAAYAPE